MITTAKLEHKSFTVDHDGLETLADMFARADKNKLLGRKFFKRLFAKKSPLLTLLHNGKRLQLPQDLDKSVQDGDEITLLTPTMGG